MLLGFEDFGGGELDVEAVLEKFLGVLLSFAVVERRVKCLFH